MNNNFPVILSQLSAFLGLRKYVVGDIINYNGKKGELFAFTKQYDDGLELICVHGKLSNDMHLEGLPVSGDDNWVFSFAINNSIKMYDAEVLQTDIRESDSAVIYNRHYGFNIQLKAGQRFFLISMRLRNEPLKKLKGIIKSQNIIIPDTDGYFMFLKLFISPEIREQFTRIAGHKEMESGFLSPYLYSKSIELCILFLYDISLANNNDMAISEYKMQLAQKVRDIVFSDLSVHYSIEDIAKQLLVSETVIKETFAKVFGVPIYTFYQEKRLEVAKSLLNADSASVTEIAYQLGFSTPSNFIKFFRSKVGMSPVQYKKKKL